MNRQPHRRRRLPSYGGTDHGATISHMTITGNRFSQGFYTLSGLYSPVAYYTYGTTGVTIPAPRINNHHHWHHKLTNHRPPETTTNRKEHHHPATTPHNNHQHNDRKHHHHDNRKRQRRLPPRAGDAGVFGDSSRR